MFFLLRLRAINCDFLDPEPVRRWQKDCRAIRLDEFVNHIERSRLAKALGISHSLDLRLLAMISNTPADFSI
jgi:hypothetical protein